MLVIPGNTDIVVHLLRSVVAYVTPLYPPRGFCLMEQFPLFFSFFFRVRLGIIRPSPSDIKCTGFVSFSPKKMKLF